MQIHVYDHAQQVGQAAATLLTYGFERPVAKLLGKKSS